MTATTARRFRSSDAYRLHLVDRTPEPEPWVHEVEQWAIAESWFWTVDTDPDERCLLLAETDDGDVCGVAACELNAPDVAYVPAVVVFDGFRGQGHGPVLFDAVLDVAEAMTGGGVAWWLVHPENNEMIALSEKVKAASTPTTTGYVRFEVRLA